MSVKHELLVNVHYGKRKRKKIINRRKEKKQFQIIIQKEFLLSILKIKLERRKKRGSFGGEKLFKEK